MRHALPLGLCAIGCTEGGDPALGRKFVDRFERSDVGPDWRDTSSGKFRIEDGELCVEGARNHPLWLRRSLPDRVRIELTVRSESEDGDIKVEVFGDGRSHATSLSYTATSYVLVFGGWQNSLSVLARMDEHGADRQTRRSPSVEADRRYRFRIDRGGDGVLAWRIDGEPFLTMRDESPLRGPGHDHFALNDWDAKLCFDDLSISAP